MPGVFHDNPYNSTFFTSCCKVAITSSGEKCPVCRKYVYPFTEQMTENERNNYSEAAVDRARWNYVKRYK